METSSNQMQTPQPSDPVNVLISAVSERRPVLVLDLDETCVFSTSLKPPEKNFPIRVGKHQLFIQVRPGMPECIKQLSSMYEIFFFTASKPNYANKIIDNIAPYVDRDHRFFVTSSQKKDLTVINRPLAQVLLLDNATCSEQVANLLIISTWVGDTEDKVFTNELMPLLTDIVGEQDLLTACHSIVSSKRYPSLKVVSC
ncbi:NLI interacting factor-like phosphatase family protein [Trichomonas vaginalis G3]|uniref:Mitochondrial import inner membrane translocase subunit TIM50 n=1 Tax=Trichomonas vaginalis (strain ATCC PRA-98 / G3) TaxID=412133 RepID=A2DKK7_TRIV3|nr:phosphoprotein phosphatase protein [Trichomonas vaginalis G3]EAY18990.1 NLI interacting factor-like phosphatase family protein [Trichomonas vaginalis G3]KAI5521217.1 phosphoprotein phosphatase protein [Trichomonas vaginalis G3]|eukprot:XP_001579976.1 NLI interacting factor-like phosphatase family protein [Trichomonas vaginalis G3]